MMVLRSRKKGDHMYTFFVLVYFVGDIQLNLAFYPNKDDCLEVKKRATDATAELKCIGITTNKNSPLPFDIKKWV